MSAPLYEVSVVSVEDNEAIFRVTISDPSEESLPQEANFAVQAVIEAWDLAMHGDFDDSINPIDLELLRRKAENSPFKKQLERWASYMYGGRKEVSVEDYRDMEKNFFDERHRFPANLSKWEQKDGKFFMLLDPLDSAVLEVSDDQILHCALKNIGEDDQGRPSGELVFTVDDDGILAHLIDGTTWETDRYDL